MWLAQLVLLHRPAAGVDRAGNDSRLGLAGLNVAAEPPFGHSRFCLVAQQCSELMKYGGIWRLGCFDHAPEVSNSLRRLLKIF